MAELVIKIQSGEEQTFTLPSETSFELRIGRDETSDILLEDTSVSRRHASIIREGGKYFLKDSNSTTGTTINGRQIQECELNDGDQISLGPVGAFFRLADQTDDSKQFENTDESRLEIEDSPSNNTSSRWSERVVYHLHRLSVNFRTCCFSSARRIGLEKFKPIEKASVGVAGIQSKNSRSTLDGSTSVLSSVRFFDVRQVLCALKEKPATNAFIFISGFFVLMFFILIARPRSDGEEIHVKTSQTSRLDAHTASTSFGGKIDQAGSRIESVRKSQISTGDSPGSRKFDIVGKYRRGPVIKGFQLGMKFMEFDDNFKKIYTEEFKISRNRFRETKKLGDPVYDDLLGDGKRFEQIIFTMKNSRPVCEVTVVGGSEIVLQIKLMDCLLLKMHDLAGMKFRDFCQEMINEYGVPELKPVPDSFGKMSMFRLGHHSKDEGYSIVFSGPVPSVSLGISKMEVSRDRGFGR